MVRDLGWPYHIYRPNILYWYGTRQAQRVQGARGSGAAVPMAAACPAACDTVTQYMYGSCFARFGKHSMLLYIHACMNVSFTRPPALRARQYGSRCCAYRP
jgi:hypothetical protein